MKFNEYYLFRESTERMTVAQLKPGDKFQDSPGSIIWYYHGNGMYGDPISGKYGPLPMNRVVWRHKTLEELQADYQKSEEERKRKEQEDNPYGFGGDYWKSDEDKEAEAAAQEEERRAKEQEMMFNKFKKENNTVFLTPDNERVVVDHDNTMLKAINGNWYANFKNVETGELKRVRIGPIVPNIGNVEQNKDGTYRLGSFAVRWSNASEEELNKKFLPAKRPQLELDAGEWWARFQEVVDGQRVNHIMKAPLFDTRDVPESHRLRFAK